MNGQSTAGRAAIGGTIGAGLALLTGSTLIGIAIVAVLGAGLAAKSGGGSTREE
jgi:hypothetical protein